MAERLPGVLTLGELGEARFMAPHPDVDPEGRDVVFSGQVLAQMIMASSLECGGVKETKSIHAIFSRAGMYSAGPLTLEVETMHAGRNWGSDTVTVIQNERLLARGLVLLNTVEPDLIRHGPDMPNVPGPDGLDPEPARMVFPDSEMRTVDAPDAVAPDGSPAHYCWVRHRATYASVAANQAVLAWCQPGFVIGLALRAHDDVASISDAHKSISTGVIAHTAHFHDDFDVGEWLLIAQQATYAGRGRVFGSGAVFSRDGKLVSTFAQDSMARRSTDTSGTGRAL